MYGDTHTHTQPSGKGVLREEGCCQSDLSRMVCFNTHSQHQAYLSATLPRLPWELLSEGHDEHGHDIPRVTAENTHKHKHRHIHTHRHTHTQSPICKHTHTHTFMCPYANTHTQLCAHVHIYTHTYVPICKYTHIYTRNNITVLTHIRSQTQTNYLTFIASKQTHSISPWITLAEVADV